MSGAPRQAIQSVQRAMKLLSAFTPETRQWSVSDLARWSGLHKSVVARLMGTMAMDGFVVQDPTTRTYTIGPQGFAVGSAYEPYTMLDRIARPVMQELAVASGHACALGVPVGREFMYLIVVEGPRSTPIRVTIEVGARRPYHAAAIGKILLAHMPPVRAHDILGDGPLPKLTPHTIDSVERIDAELSEVRRTGIATSQQEAIIGAGAVAAGIKNAQGETIAGLNVTYLIHIVPEEERATLAHLTVEAARRISQRVGTLSLEGMHRRPDLHRQHDATMPGATRPPSRADEDTPTRS
jgi:DNA-binding IclR family transcriptional regulator